MKTIINTITLLFTFCFIVLSEPSDPTPFQITQPDGSKLFIRLIGDEFFHCHQTVDGLVIDKNIDGIYEYIDILDNDSICLSGIKANDIDKRNTKENDYLDKIKNKDINKILQEKNKDNIRSHILQEQNIKTLQNKTATQTFTGTKNILCILIDYQDVAFNKTQTDFNNLMNTPSYNSTGSVRDFYLENSYGQLSLNFTVTGPYTADHPMSYYGANDSNGNDIRPEYLIKEALEKANPYVNYADFDNDGDGVLDGVHVIYAGYAENIGPIDPNRIWPHKGIISGPFWGLFPYELDGVKITGYSCSSELRDTYGTNICGIGTICHELGHVFGSPDYYDINREVDGNYDGTGEWDLMGRGSKNGDRNIPAHFNPYTKINTFGWATAQNLPTDNTQINLYPSYSNNNSFYKITTPTPGEYFLLENRQNFGFDASLPGHGMIIWHVHKDIESDNYAINTTHPQRLYPVCANSTHNPTSDPLSYGTIDGHFCPFPGWGNKTSFSFNTIPTAISWIGHSIGNIHFITELNNNISFVINPEISGPSAICPNSTGTFTINNSSPNYIWNKSSNLTLASSSNNSVTLSTSNFGGNAWVSFSNNGIEVARKNFIIGSQIAGNDQICSVGTNRYNENPSCSSGMNNMWILTWSNMNLLTEKPDTVYGKNYVDIVSTSSPNNMAWYSLRLIQPSGNETIKEIPVQNVKLALLGKKLPDPFDPIELIIYPNPAEDILYVSFSSQPISSDSKNIETNYSDSLKSKKLFIIEPYTIKIFDSNQTLIKSTEETESIIQISVQDLPRGTYYLHFIRNDKVLQKRIIKLK